MGRERRREESSVPPYDPRRRLFGRATKHEGGGVAENDLLSGLNVPHADGG